MPQPAVPTAASTAVHITKYRDWWKDDSKVCTIIECRVTPVTLALLPQGVAITARSIWDVLSTLYSRKNMSQFKLCNHLSNTKLKDHHDLECYFGKFRTGHLHFIAMGITKSLPYPPYSWWTPDGLRQSGVVHVKSIPAKFYAGLLVEYRWSLTAGFIVEQKYQEFRWSPTGVQGSGSGRYNYLFWQKIPTDLLKFLSTPILCKDLTAGGRRDTSDIWNLCWALGDVMLKQTIVDIVSRNNTVPEEQVEHFLEKVTDIFPYLVIQYDHCKALPLAEVLLHCSGDESPAHDEWDFTRSTIKDNVFVNYICGQLLDLIRNFNYALLYSANEKTQ
ncbi:hypothetical protein BDZ97DRAFT_1752314 [Flammula alnicola]|nr:hypothetical protein BDZ97DRAFT_1752314 [Flammula alnicola]